MERGDQLGGHLAMAAEMEKKGDNPPQRNILKAENICMIVKLQNQTGVA